LARWNPPSGWLTKPSLLGSRVLLRPFEEQDMPAIGEALADPEVLKFTGSAHTSEEAHGRSPVLNQAMLDWYRSRRTVAGRLDLAIVDLATGGCVGEAVLNDYSPANASCRVEGTARDALRFDGTWIDAIYMSILSTDPELKASSTPTRTKSAPSSPVPGRDDSERAVR
jgi:RimJ/RimL family protein N-acetyltransferase